MSFDYDKLKSGQDESAASKMASYSDLFMVLSFVFLLLYVVTSIRNGVNSVFKHSELKEKAAEADDLRQQLKVYNALKEDQLQKVAEDEKDVYKELMSKLELLQEESKKEKDELRKQALENEKKEVALNKYQQIVRNIINANILAKSRIQRRDVNITKKRKTITEQKDDIVFKKKIITEKQEVIEVKQKLIENKDKIISENEKVIDKKSRQVSSLKKDVEEKKRSIKVNTEQIQSLNNSLTHKIAEMNAAYKKHKVSKKKMKSAIENLKKSTAVQVSKLRGKSNKVAKQLESVNSKLFVASNQLSQANQLIEEQNQEKSKLSQELQEASKTFQKLQQENDEAYKKLQQEHQAQIASVNQEYENRTAKQKADFAANMKAEKLSASDRASKEKAFRAKLLSQKDALALKITGLQKGMEETNKALMAEKAARGRATAAAAAAAAALEKEKKIADAKIKKQKKDFNKKMDKAEKRFLRNLEKQRLSSRAKAKKMREFKNRVAKEKKALNTRITRISDDLKKARELLRAKKKVAREIAMNFKKAGIDADVDVESGDVTLSFGKDYFKTGKATLKPSMKDTLKKFMPAYTKSLFKDPVIAKKIKTVEIIGFSSPTYRGKFINPSSLDPKLKRAIDFNLNLSIKRARSIFNFITDIRQLRYKYQNNLQQKIKVSGRGFFAEDIAGVRGIASEMSQRQFCKQYNCKKAQRVIIKFNLDNK